MPAFVSDILIAAAPLLLASLGALASERAGILAVFSEGIINLSAFCCFSAAVCLAQAGLPQIPAALFAGAAAVCVCTALMYGIARFSQYTRANYFLTALAANALSNGLITVLSPLVYHTKGVLTSAVFQYTALFSRVQLSCIGWLLALVCMAVYEYTKSGQYIKICGSDADVLAVRGVSAAKWQNISWCIAAAGSACAGCILAFRLSAFVPNISSGMGWTALAAVFLGRRTTAGTAAAVLLFTAAQYGANNMQNISWLPSIPSAVLLAFPYLTALLFLVLSPQRGLYFRARRRQPRRMS